MGYWAGYVFLFCLVAILLILGSLTLMAFGEPSKFVKWLTPLYWLSRKVLRDMSGSWDSLLAGAVGLVTFALLLSVCFALGGIAATLLWDLYRSPFSHLVFR